MPTWPHLSEKHSLYEANSRRVYRLEQKRHRGHLAINLIILSIIAEATAKSHWGFMFIDYTYMPIKIYTYTIRIGRGRGRIRTGRELMEKSGEQGRGSICRSI